MVTWDVVLHADCAQPVVVVVGRVVDVADGWRPVVKVQARAA